MLHIHIQNSKIYCQDYRMVIYKDVFLFLYFTQRRLTQYNIMISLSCKYIVKNIPRMAQVLIHGFWKHKMFINFISDYKYWKSFVKNDEDSSIKESNIFHSDFTIYRTYIELKYNSLWHSPTKSLNTPYNCSYQTCPQSHAPFALAQCLA